MKKKYVFYSITPPGNRAVCEIMCEKMWQNGATDHKQHDARKLRFACRITKEWLHSKYVKLIDFSLHNGYANEPRCHITRNLLSC